MATSERMSRDARIVLVGSGVSAFGEGLILPFLLIYLHEVRKIPLDRTGLVLAVPGVVGLIAGPVAGTLVDRIGARTVMAVGSVLSAVAVSLLATVHTVGEAVPVVALVGICNASSYPAQSSLFGRLATGATQTRLFALNFVLLNAGIGLGGLASGLLVNVHHPGTFQLIYLIDGATFLAYAGAVLFIRERGPAVSSDGEVLRAGSYREVLRHPLFIRVFVLTMLLALTGYAQIDSGLPAFATTIAHVPPRTIALSFVANTSLIVVGQLVILRRLEGIRRTRALLVVISIWGASWLLLGLAGVLPNHLARECVVIAFGGLFGLGETFLAPTVGPMTNDIAPEHLVGRFNALGAMAFSVGFSITPAISAFLIGAHLSLLWLLLLLVGLAASALATVRLEPRLTPAQNGIAEPGGARPGAPEGSPQGSTEQAERLLT